MQQKYSKLGGVEIMWISKKKWENIEKRITDLEKQVQRQPSEIFSVLVGIYHEQMKKSGGTSHSNFGNCESQCDE